MITLEVNMKNQRKRIELQDEVLFNSLLSQNEVLIKKLIKNTHPLYKISNTFFEIINKFVDINENGMSLYGGLIVRTGFTEFAVLYLEKSTLNDDYIVKLIDDYIRDIGENISKTVTVNKIEIDVGSFLRAVK